MTVPSAAGRHPPHGRWWVGVLVVAMAVGSGCSTDDGPEPDVARISVDGDATDVDLTACGRDGRTVFLVGRSGDGLVLQAVVGLEDEGDEVDLAATAVTVDRDGEVVAAAGPVAAPGLQLTGAPPGEIRSATVEGDRVQLTADVDRVADDRSSTGEKAGELRLDARCPDDATG